MSRASMRKTLAAERKLFSNPQYRDFQEMLAGGGKVKVSDIPLNIRKDLGMSNNQKFRLTAQGGLKLAEELGKNVRSLPKYMQERSRFSGVVNARDILDRAYTTFGVPDSEKLRLDEEARGGSQAKTKTPKGRQTITHPRLTGVPEGSASAKFAPGKSGLELQAEGASEASLPGEVINAGFQQDDASFLGNLTKGGKTSEATQQRRGDFTRVTGKRAEDKFLDKRAKDPTAELDVKDEAVMRSLKDQAANPRFADDPDIAPEFKAREVEKSKRLQEELISLGVSDEGNFSEGQGFLDKAGRFLQGQGFTTDPEAGNLADPTLEQQEVTQGFGNQMLQQQQAQVAQQQAEQERQLKLNLAMNSLTGQNEAPPVGSQKYVENVVQKVKDGSTLLLQAGATAEQVQQKKTTAYRDEAVRILTESGNVVNDQTISGLAAILESQEVELEEKQ